ncbi:MAG: hypothetical protein AAGC67_21805 [Myxococcota bacterium]
MRRGLRAPSAGAVVALLAATVLAWPSLAPRSAQAFIPKADRTIREIAQVNRSSGRSQAIQLDLTMRVGERDPVARGQLISHPSGLARLELRGFNGRIDRYLLSGRELAGAKDGLRIERPQPLLQPLFFLQPSTSSTLRTALESFDVLSDSIGLATCGDQDCYVIGDPRLAAPLPEPEMEALASEPDELLLELLGDYAEEGNAFAAAMESALSAEGRPEEDDAADGLTLLDPLGEDGSIEASFPVPGDTRLPRLWVDTEDLQVRRIDRASGVFTIFGPVVSFERLRIPAWFEIHEPGAEPIRFEVDRAVQVNAPPQAFSRKWLLAPVGEPADGSGQAPPPAAPNSP